VMSLTSWRALGYDQHSIMASPTQLFVGGSDYHLKDGSPAIDVGVTLADVTRDLDGNARPIGARFDVGVYEAGSAWPDAEASVNPIRGTVNTWATASVSGYPPNHSLYVRWDGALLGTYPINAIGAATARFRIPAAPQGNHVIRFSATGVAKTVNYEIVPRIKLIPGTAARGQTVDVSLRGFGARETVRIRWQRGATWIQLAQVTTSSTGSANIDVNVPTWALDGPASVRGDGPIGRAQTNAFVVTGGPFNSATGNTPTPTSTATPAATVKATMTATPEVATVEPTATETSLPEASPVG
jgi:hypothetical protein